LEVDGVALDVLAEDGEVVAEVELVLVRFAGSHRAEILARNQKDGNCPAGLVGKIP